MEQSETADRNRIVQLTTCFQVDGMMVWISSGENIVWGLSENGELWYRAGISQSIPMGTNWFKMNTGKEKNIVWKMVAGEAGLLWGLDNGNKLLARKNATNENIQGNLPQIV